MPADSALRLLDRLGRRTVGAVAEFGFGAALLGESLYWLAMGRRRRQPVRLRAIAAEAMSIGIAALPIVTVLAGTIGVMLAIQGIYTLRIFGAESRVTVGIAMSTVREFSPLITGILVAGRSGSALAARLGTMRINQEIDALTVMGIAPVRFLVVPAMVAMVVMLPLMTLWADLVSLFAAGLYVAPQLGSNMAAYADEMLALVKVNDVLHGMVKAGIFALMITIVGVVNGASVTGGAEGVGRMTTRSVVHAISAIVITDMVFVFMVTR